jgi:hypothetical protein
MNLAIITEVPEGKLFSRDYLKSVVRRLVRRERGPQAVMSSLLRGLFILGVDYSLNPKKEQLAQADAVWVNGSLDALRWAIKAKQRGAIKKLVAGPNLVILPSSNGHLVCAPEIDRYLVVSDWTYDAYLADCPELAGCLAIWPAGVDARLWSPAGIKQKTGRVLVYKKHADETLVVRFSNLLTRKGYEVVRLDYGKYNKGEYLKLLRSVDLMVYFTASESQGIALAEAWSVGVPTLVWNPQGLVAPLASRGIEIKMSAAPFLTDQTGAFFLGEEEFVKNLARLNDASVGYAPREYVLEQMTDEICAKKFLSLLN